MLQEAARAVAVAVVWWVVICAGRRAGVKTAEAEVVDMAGMVVGGAEEGRREARAPPDLPYTCVQNKLSHSPRLRNNIPHNTTQCNIIQNFQ